MAGNMVNIKICSQLKLQSGLTKNNNHSPIHKIYRYVLLKNENLTSKIKNEK